MKRYEMTAEYNRYACSDEVIPVESADGDWIKFSDYQAATEAAKATGTTGEQDGWKIVPRKMTDEQAKETAYNINRKYKVAGPLSDFLVRQIWEFGIYASPNPPAEAARQPAPVVAGCGLCGGAIGHDLDCQNHPANARELFQQDEEHKAFMATYLDIARKASDNTSAAMILWHANRHWNGKAGEMWRARAALAATAAPVLSDDQRKSLEYIANWMDSSVRIIQNAPDDYGPASQFDYDMGQAAHEILSILAATRSQP